MVFIENDVSTMEVQSSKSKCVFFFNQTEILGVGIGAGVLVISAILAVIYLIFKKKKNVFIETEIEKDSIEHEVVVCVHE